MDFHTRIKRVLHAGAPVIVGVMRYTGDSDDCLQDVVVWYRVNNYYECSVLVDE